MPEYRRLKKSGVLEKDEKPWEQQPGESDPFFAEFQTYLLTRSVVKTMRVHGIVVNENNRRTMTIHKTEYRWGERALAFDRWIASNRETAVAEMIQLEVVQIAKQRSVLLTDLYHKVLGIGKKITAQSSAKEVNSYSRLIKSWDELVRQVEASAGAEMMVGKEAPLTTPNIARELLRQRMEDINKKKAPPAPGTPDPTETILQ